MKKNILLTTLGLAFTLLALKARAQVEAVENPVDAVRSFTFTCSNETTKEQININHLDTATNSLLNADIELSQPQNLSQKFSAQYQIEKSPLYKVYKYTLYKNQVQVGELKISQHTFIGRGGCGRGGCDNALLSSTQAELKLGLYETTFDCY
jgi:tRNA U38,U39,U40 pseudouridine synthase TruA